MFMENKKILCLFLFFFACKEKNIEQCNLGDTPMGNYVFFIGFNDKIGKITFESLSSKNRSFSYQNPNLEYNGVKEFRLKINTTTIDILQKDCVIIIDDSLKFKISGVKVNKVQRSTMWNKKLFCELNEYKLNDSLIENHNGISVYR
ncbi:hypothetical protein SAMN05421786_1193 [Chryseobacterium ureilyticum]|uniref:Lipoprotein n=2 Tax=Chryseobacterium ureilyticum TaxID=373668 RepID=A0A1N7QUC8_9FLAO|nr:hypothetical protein SAMN05421786_1193 [Chryseobacterium ureilyticum]